MKVSSEVISGPRRSHQRHGIGGTWSAQPSSECSSEHVSPSVVAKKSLCLPLLAYDSTIRPSYSLITTLTEIFWPSLITVGNSVTSEPVSRSSFMNIQSLQILPCRFIIPCCDVLPVCNERHDYSAV